jgi:hypothetical protein
MHLTDSFLYYGHLTVDQQAFEKKTKYGQQAFGQKIFGQKTFVSYTFGKREILFVSS